MNLSIIIVNWNTKDMLRDCLMSVQNGSGNIETETIVVDNASTDGSQQMVKQSFPEALLIENKENRGFAAANNQGLPAANGRYILLLNSDTMVLGDVLQRSVEFMDSHSDVAVMGCRVLNTDGSLQPTCSQFPSLLNLLLLTSGLWKLPWIDFFDRYQMRRWQRKEERDVDVVSGCYMVVRSDAIEEVGRLDEDFFFFGEETDWCRRFQKAGWQVRFAPVGEIIHHGGGSVRKLNFKRDLMLSSATVKLHLKHRGLASAIGAWIIVFGFNFSRAVFWSLKGLTRNDTKTRGRRDHFLSLVQNHHRIWPRRRTASF